MRRILMLDPNENSKEELEKEAAELEIKIKEQEKAKPQAGLFGTSTEAQKKYKR